MQVQVKYPNLPIESIEIDADYTALKNGYVCFLKNTQASGWKKELIAGIDMVLGTDTHDCIKAVKEEHVISITK